MQSLPSALERQDEIAARIGSGRPAVFLDYDGTLSPITDDPRKARLPAATREAMERLKDLCPVAVVSGRNLSDVKELVGVEGIYYAGSHGFEVLEPSGVLHRKGEEYLPALARAAGALEERLAEISDAWVERKEFAIAVHYRAVRDPLDQERIEDAVDRVMEGEPELRKTGGKKIFEVRPALEWDKGKVVLWILDILQHEADKDLPIYIGDDVTDEDAFRALRDRGIGIVVEGEEDRETVVDYALPDADAVRRFLEALASALSGPAA